MLCIVKTLLLRVAQRLDSK